MSSCSEPAGEMGGQAEGGSLSLYISITGRNSGQSAAASTDIWDFADPLGTIYKNVR
jgi:hypothetical protein